MRLVVALGGNALLHRGERPDATLQLEHVRAAAEVLAPLANEHELVICHGNGPQVGLLALESEADRSISRAYPFDALGAQTQGMIGYWLSQSLHNAGALGPVLSVVTQVRVDARDPAFAHPSKFVGSVYGYEEAANLAAARGWSVAADGPGWRRVVPSPEPQAIVELSSLAALLARRTTLICGGGGGAPVVELAGQLRGVEAVVDKDLTSALLAISLQADRLLILTDVSAVMLDYGTAEQTALRHVGLDELGAMSFPAGSMGPKVEACRRFVRATGKVAAIGSIADTAGLLTGDAGTQITADRPGSRVLHAATTSSHL
ncbi:MAG: carbamate kinase [Frankiales bacterium]|nr:carbamate kinase [Frankiales bacterium]